MESEVCEKRLLCASMYMHMSMASHINMHIAWFGLVAKYAQSLTKLLTEQRNLRTTVIDSQ